MTRAIRHTLAGGLLAVTMLSGMSSPHAAERWDMPSAYGANSFIVRSFADFADDVRARTEGQIDIVVHPGGSLYSGNEIMRAVRDGQVPIGERFLGAHANEDPIFGLDTLPFIASTPDDAWNLYQASRPALEEALAERNLKLLYTQLWAPQGLYSVRKIESVEDMRGLRFRAYDANTQRLAELTGATPTRTEAAEVAQAFSTGIAQAMTASGAIGVSQSIWDFAEYFYRVNAWMPKSVVIVNMDVWNDLDERTRAALEAAAADAETKVWAAMLDAEKADNETLAANGMQVLDPTAELTESLKAVGGQMTEEWIASAGERGAAIIETYRSR